MIGRKPTTVDNRRSLRVVIADFRKSLESIHSFAVREGCSGFIECFERALSALDQPGADFGYHKDLAVPHQLNDDQSAALKAAMCASVFGGMGSWNDMGFDGDIQLEYERVSTDLFNFLNEAVEIAGSDTAGFTEITAAN